MWSNIEEATTTSTARCRTDGGATWAQVGDPLTGDGDRLGPAQTWDLTPYAGQKVTFRFRYATDGGVHFEGPFLDDIAITVDGATTDRRRRGRRQRLDRQAGSPG